MMVVIIIRRGIEAPSKFLANIHLEYFNGQTFNDKNKFCKKMYSHEKKKNVKNYKLQGMIKAQQ